MKITCDPAKWEKTFNERGLDFFDAAKVFEGEVYEFQDTRQDYGETRMIAVGHLARRMVIVGYVDRSEARHIFSMRKANAREVKKYQERFEENGCTFHSSSGV